MENKPFSYSRVHLTIVALILVAGLTFSFFLFKNKLNRPDSSLSPSPTAVFTPTLEIAKSILLAKAQIQFPKVISTLSLPPDKLPQDLNDFLFNDATTISAQTLQYENGNKGYQIAYNLSTPFQDTFFRFISLTFPPDSAKWSKVFSERANLFAVVEMKNTRYQVRVNQILGENAQILISIQIIAK